MKASRSKRPNPRALGQRSSGFTLLELLVAVMLMAIVAILGWRGLDALIVARERISRAGDDIRSLAIAFAQVEEDLRRAWPVRLINTGRPAVLLLGVAELVGAPAGGAQLDLVREAPALGGAQGVTNETDPLTRRMLASGLHRVIWRLESSRLERGFVPWWWTTDQTSAPTPATDSLQERAGITWQPLLDGVEAIAWRMYVSGQGWLPAGQLPTNTQTVSGVELSLVRSGERIVRVFSVRD